MGKRVTVLVIALMLVGCVNQAQLEVQEERRQRFQDTIPICEGEADCQAKWEAAQLWVVKNAGYKIQTVTDVSIETFGATGGRVQLAARITKEPLGNGKYRIVPLLWCDNFIGCQPSVYSAGIDFNYHVGKAAP